MPNKSNYEILNAFCGTEIQLKLYMCFLKNYIKTTIRPKYSESVKCKTVQNLKLSLITKMCLK